GEIRLVGGSSLLDHELEAGDLLAGEPGLRPGPLLRRLLDLRLLWCALGFTAAFDRSDEEGRFGIVANERREPADDLRRHALGGLPDGLAPGIDLFEIGPRNVQLRALSGAQARGGRPHRREPLAECLHIAWIVQDLLLRISAQAVDELGVPQYFERSEERRVGKERRSVWGVTVTDSER